MMNNYCYTQRQRDYERDMREQEWDGYNDPQEEIDDGLDEGFSSWNDANSQFNSIK